MLTSWILHFHEFFLRPSFFSPNFSLGKISYPPRRYELCSIVALRPPLFCETSSIIYVAWNFSPRLNFKPFSHILKVVYCIEKRVAASHKLFKRGSIILSSCYEFEFGSLWNWRIKVVEEDTVVSGLVLFHSVEITVIYSHTFLTKFRESNVC